MAKAMIGVMLASMAMLTACSSVPTAQRYSKRAAAYAEAAGEPVRSFRYTQLYSWEPLGESQLALYTRPTEAWLIDTTGPCRDLSYATSIILTSNMSNVQTNLDKIIPGSPTGIPMPCYIGQIRPVDVAKLKAVEHEQRKVAGKERTDDAQ